MADHSERTTVVAEIAELQKQHSEAHINAIYLGWTLEGEAESRKRDARISTLRLQLTALDATK